jgi:hypothetical protein
MQNQLQIPFPNFDISIKVSVKDVLSPMRASLFNLMDQTELQVPYFSAFFRTDILKMRDNGMSNECTG